MTRKDYDRYSLSSIDNQSEKLSCWIRQGETVKCEKNNNKKKYKHKREKIETRNAQNTPKTKNYKKLLTKS